MNEANERRTNSKQHKMECICKVDENCKWMKVLTVWIRVFVACFFLICCEFAFGVVLKLACDYISFHLSLLMTKPLQSHGFVVPEILYIYLSEPFINVAHFLFNNIPCTMHIQTQSSTQHKNIPKAPATEPNQRNEFVHLFH